MLSADDCPLIFGSQIACFPKEFFDMTNTQVRLIASAIALLAGGVIANTGNINVNVSVIIILVSAAIFVVEYLRSQKA